MVPPFKAAIFTNKTFHNRLSFFSLFFNKPEDRSEHQDKNDTGCKTIKKNLACASIALSTDTKIRMKITL